MHVLVLTIECGYQFLKKASPLRSSPPVLQNLIIIAAEPDRSSTAQKGFPEFTHSVQCTQITAYNADSYSLTAEAVKITVCWNVTRCVWQEYTIVSEEIFLSIFRVMLVAGSSGMLVNSHQTRLHHIPEDDSRNGNCFYWSENILNENVPLSK